MQESHRLSIIYEKVFENVESAYVMGRGNDALYIYGHVRNFKYAEIQCGIKSFSHDDSEI